MISPGKSLAYHGAILALLAVLFFVLPTYHVGNLSRILVLAIYAMGYNLLFGYTGLLSLGHALFFAAGMYGYGLAAQHLSAPTLLAFLLGPLAAAIVAATVGYLALRTREVAFMIVTLMFSQAGYLLILYYSHWTEGDDGFNVPSSARMLFGLDLTSDAARFWTAFILFALAFVATAILVTSRLGRALIAVRENEERAKMLGYDTHRLQYIALILSGTIAGLAGATYGLLFGYVGATFATVEYSILPLLWVLLGGAGTTVGPLIGAAFMTYLIIISSGLTDAYMFIAGIALVLLCLFAPHGIAGTLRNRALRWLP